MLVVRITVLEQPDGSRIEVNKYRANEVAPWISGMYDIICGQCDSNVGEIANETEARLFHLQHQLEHVQEELAAYRAAFHNLGRRAT